MFCVCVYVCLWGGAGGGGNVRDAMNGVYVCLILQYSQDHAIVIILNP